MCIYWGCERGKANGRGIVMGFLTPGVGGCVSGGEREDGVYGLLLLILMNGRKMKFRGS